MIGGSRDAGVAECSRLYTKWDNERSGEIGSQLGTRKLDRQVQKRMKFGWNTYRGCHQKELHSNSQNQPIESRDLGRPRRALNGITCSTIADDDVRRNTMRLNYREIITSQRDYEHHKSTWMLYARRVHIFYF
jgi:hypothetical protein